MAKVYFYTPEMSAGKSPVWSCSPIAIIRNE